MADPLIGTLVADRYRIVSLLGRGGMGVVYKVEHAHIGKVMAMKLLHGEMARRKDMARRFRREAETVSQLSHPNTVQIFDFGESQGLMYLVMEYIDGRNLDDIVNIDGALPFPRVARLSAQVCASVAEAHACGIVHRDLKPENVMVSTQGDTVKVLDFGLAKLREGKDAGTVTATGMIVGTPHYMSPEQIKGEDVDARGDVYALGAMIYKLCTGEPPFEGDSPLQVLTQHLTEPIVPPSELVPGLPPEADAIVMRAMQKEPADRFQSATELRAALVGYLRHAGEDLTDPSLRVQGPVDVPTVTAVRPRLQLATREDVDHFEVRRRRTRGAAGSVLLFVALLCAGLLSYLLVQHAPRTVDWDVSESEPNDAFHEANDVPERERFTAHIGQRRGLDQGDVDVFRLAGSAGEDAIALTVSGLPNMALVVEVFHEGQSRPFVTLDAHGVGEGEGAPNLPANRASTLVRVSERAVPGQLPTENISDAYTVRWERVPRRPGFEHEPNDSLERAQPVRFGEAIEGYVGWPGDIDVFCLEGPAGPAVAEVSGVAGLDLVLRVVDRVQATSRRVNEHGVGEGETSPPIADAQAGRTCVEVAARAGTEGALRARPDARYVLQLRPAPPRSAP